MTKHTTPAALAAEAKHLADECKRLAEHYRAGPGWPMVNKELLFAEINKLAALASQAREAAEVPATDKDSLTVPAGFVIVPVEPTEAMCQAAVIFANGNAVYKNVKAEVLKIEESIYGEAYTAMLSAAPPAPAGVVREPLTDQEIVVLRWETRKGDHAPRASDLAFARAIERAHGIAPLPAASKGDA